VKQEPNKIAIISIYFGKLPEWFPLFLLSCNQNPEIDFIIFCDANINFKQSHNIRLVHFTINDFNALASNSLRLNIAVQTPYKLCDFKPAFGNIFADYLTGYSFWGYCDSDMIFGKIVSFITAGLLKKYDVICTYQGFLSGPFCLYRNCAEINNLFLNAEGYEEKLTWQQHLGFDENIAKMENEGVLPLKIFYFLLYLIQLVFTHPSQLLFMKEMRYQFQWFFKKKMSIKCPPADMTEVIWQARHNKAITLFNKELIVSPDYFRRRGVRKWNLLFNTSGLLDTRLKNQVFAFHLRASVHANDFYINPKVKRHFLISGNGINSPNA
jgi:hypothetical protein